MSRKVWLLNIPRLDDNLPTGIKEVCNIFQKNNVLCEIIDVNHQIYKNFYQTPNWQNIENFGIKNMFDISLVPISKVEKIFKDETKSVSPGDILVLSVFSTESRSWAILFLVFIKKYFKNKVRVGMGGSGLRHPGETLYESEWADKFLKSKLCDFIFLGESSLTIKEQIEKDFKINGKLYNQSNKFPELGFLPLDLIKDKKKRVIDENYTTHNNHGESVGLNKSQKIHFTAGCVKQCTFCDVPLITPQWAMRKAEKVIEEIDYYFNLNETVNFSFPDNTINGSDSEFLKFLRLLEKWQSKNKKISWTANFSIKQKKQQTDELFILLNKTNAHLKIGFDHCSDKVLNHMKKLYTWADCENFILNSLHHNFSIETGMWIVGYPTETDQDLKEYNKLFNLLKRHNKIIKSHSVLICSINRNSELLQLIDINWHYPLEWIAFNGLNKQTRISRKKWVDDNLFSLNQNYFKHKTTVLRTDIN